MHTGCSGNYESGQQIIDKIRMMGFNTNSIAVALSIACANCKKKFKMKKMESTCPACGMVYGVTPCQSHSSQSVKAAGIHY